MIDLLLIGWGISVLLVMVLIPILFPSTLHGILTLIARCTTKKIRAQVWNKSCDTVVISDTEERTVEKTSNHQLDLTYELYDTADHYLSTFYTNVPVDINTFQKCSEGDNISIGHVKISLLGVCRIIPTTNAGRVYFKSCFAAFVPLAWFLACEIFTLKFITYQISPSNYLLLQLAPAAALFVGFVLCCIMFVANVFGIRKDAITSMTPSSIHASDAIDVPRVSVEDSSPALRSGLEDSSEDSNNDNDTSSLIGSSDRRLLTDYNEDIVEVGSSRRPLEVKIVVQQGDFQRTIGKKKVPYKGPIGRSNSPLGGPLSEPNTEDSILDQASVKIRDYKGKDKEVLI
eukprot:TRINITY_DN6977_c0_g1_i1.p1 TRINITY_DN6977_c0_g1~~TRINITY_DN6977_c0_g1_i1.p1  ORF type:complete len:344 (-),score=38.97 TRINITY_DN6977_c0_g1_i1:301-1332(-)